MPSLFILKKFRDWEGASRVSACCTSVENWVQISPNTHQSEHHGACNRSEGGRLRQDYVAHTRQANPIQAWRMPWYTSHQLWGLSAGES